ncbi:MAG TPA: MBL fold metallo-hydrolase [Gemmatimonadaceae bacterium]|nr:MBL fold metallo-hydrolase [Gemmatimonadaceae bacterium]
MFLRRFYDEPLSQASYMLGCQAAGVALVVDPNRDTAQYHAAAREENVRITHVAETHIHADFLSGGRQLARESGARLLLSAEGGETWQYAFADEENALLLHDGDRFEVGAVRLDVLHTPGHTPEHLSFLVTDTAAAEKPLAALTGDFLFVGDVGRPDLLERAAHIEGTMEASARALFRSLRRFAELPDYLQLWPGHGAGSACGKALGAMPQSTLGYEKIANWAFAIEDEDEFVEEVLAGQPAPPTYFAVMKRLNRDGPAVLEHRPAPREEAPDALVDVLREGGVVVDLRGADAFRAGHVPGTLSISYGRSFVGWAGWLLAYDRDVYLIAAGTGDAARTLAERAAMDLSLIGIDRVRGYFTEDALESWKRECGALETVTDLEVEALEQLLRRGDAQLIDVRARSEWEGGHIAGARNIPLGEIAAGAPALASSGPVIVHCASGARSTIASSILLASGVRDVINVRGGLAAWRGAGLALADSE